MKRAASWLASLLRMPLAFLFGTGFCIMFAALAGGVLRPAVFLALGAVIFAAGKASQSRRDRKEARDDRQSDPR